jgi:hypothetical protein
MGYSPLKVPDFLQIYNLPEPEPSNENDWALNTKLTIDNVVKDGFSFSSGKSGNSSLQKIFFVCYFHDCICDKYSL